MTDVSSTQEYDAETDVGAAEDASATSETPGADSTGSDGAQDKPKRGRPRKKSGGFELVLTVKGSSDGADWQAEVAQGGKKVVSDVTVSASAVAAAAKDLHPDIAEAIESVLSEARERHRSRVEQLQAELEAAQRALADLQD